jgi:steroid delta-isomerase
MSIARHHLPHVHAAVVYFEQLQAADLPRLGELFHPQARFKDPFNEVEGLAAIERIFAHMYQQVDQPHFVIHQVVAEGRQCFVSWDFKFQLRGSPIRAMTVRGATHWQFNSDGLITEHRDYWDAAEELYAKMPVLGALMRWLRRQGSARA